MSIRQPNRDICMLVRARLQRIHTEVSIHEETNPEEVLDRMRKCLWLTKLDKDVKDMWAEMDICRGDDVMDMNSGGLKSPDRITKENIVGGLTNERFFCK